MSRSNCTKEYLILHSKLYCIVNGDSCFFGLKNARYTTEIKCTFDSASKYCNYELSFDVMLTVYSTLLSKYFDIYSRVNSDVLPF